MTTSSRPLTDRAAFENFKEAHPELGSALKIAAIPESEFVSTFANELDGGERQAFRIHQTAVRVQQQAALVWANLKDLASPYLQQTLFNNIPQSFLDQQQKIPGYDRLFGSLDYIECDEARSVLSPAAYFVDLMRFVEENITNNPENRDIPADCQLDQRRPDLFRIKLDEANTNDLIPYIDLVNIVLEGLVTSEQNPDAEVVIEAAVFPQSLPLNLPLEEIRAYLKQLNLDLPRVYETFATPTDSKESAKQRERLVLSPQEFALLGNALVDEPLRLAEVYGFDTLESALQELASVDVFLERTGLTRQELDNLIFQDLDNFEANVGLSRLFFINAVEDGLGQLAIEQGPTDADNPTRPPAETLINLSAAKLDRIYRFLKLARRLEWSFADLDWALRSLELPYEPERVLQFDGLNDFVQVAAQTGTAGSNSTPSGLAALQGTFTVEAWVNPSRHKVNPILCRGLEDNPNIHFSLCLDAGGRVAFYRSTSASEFPVTSLQSLTVGEFAHVAVTVQTARNQSTVQIFINGRLDQTGTLPAVQVPAGNLAVNIGRNLSDVTFAGSIKDVRVWSEVRSAVAITSIRYRRLTGFETNLAAYWPLTESHGVELFDRTPFKQHGVLGGEQFVTQPTWITADLVLEPLPERIGAMGYQFNGDDQYLAARDVTGLEANEFTLEAQIRVDAEGQHPIITKGNPGNRRVQFALRMNEQNRLVFRSTSLGSGEFVSQSEIAPGTFTHVAVTVSATEIRLYLDGRLDRTLPRPANSAIAPQGDELTIGHDFGSHYFNGVIQEVRVWKHPRSVEEINSFRQRAVPVLAPGLIGYWPLSEVAGEQAVDLSVNGNALCLGGVPADFQPDVVEVAPLLPALPVVVPGKALIFDGDQDLLVLRHDTNFGLGRYPTFTLEFWFKPTRQALHPEAPQLLFSQGDGEAGLAVYLEGSQMVAIAWSANYELTEVQETVLVSAQTAILQDQWHHVAIIHDETQNLDTIEFRGFLNGAPLTESSSTHSNPFLMAGQRGYRLSPVGVTYLGGIDGTGMTRFQGEYLLVDDARLHGFSGLIADLRLWKIARTTQDIDAGRHRAPELDAAGLMAYLPLDEGQDVTVTDRVNGYTGQLRGKEAVFMATPTSDPELENRYTHYAPAGEAVLDWSNYIYSGLFYVPEIPAGLTTGGLGVTFLSRYPEQIDQFYRLQVTWADGQPKFSLAAHPQGVQPLTVDQGTFPAAQPGTWYAFSVQVTDNTAENRTTIAVTLWPDGSRKPRSPQVTAHDASDVRIQSGAVGLWVAGDQPQTLAARFNNLRVVPLATDGSEGPALLNATFKHFLPGQNPTGWVDTGARLTPQNASSLFRTLSLNGKTVLGTDSTLQGIHAHYTPAGENVLTWRNYVYQGRLRFSDANSGIGLTFLSRTPAGIDQYYALRRDAATPTFHLVAHPLGVQTLTAEPDSSLKSSLAFQPETDYFVQVEVETGADRTNIRAKIWQAGTLEPSSFEIRAFDDSDIRITAGTVGIWTSGPGTKTFDDLKVLQETLLSEDFSAFGPNQDPPDWLDTAANNSRREAPELFRTAERDGTIVFGTQSNQINIHSHYRPAAALQWQSYTYTGKMLIAPDANGAFDGIGVTFFSQFTDPQAANHNEYYRLRRFSGFPTFHIAPRPQGQRTVNPVGLDTGVNPLPNTWYRFLIEAHDAGNRTLIRAKVWPDGTPEPTQFQAETFDENNSTDTNSRRLTAGTIGLWASQAGSKFFDDLKVRRGVYLTANLSLRDWQATGFRNAFELNDGLFAAERIPDHPVWIDAEDIPLLRQPLNLKSLQFDGEQEYLALASLKGELAGSFTLEAWIQPGTATQEKPVFSWGEHVWFGLNAAGQVSLKSGIHTFSGQTVLPASTFTHVAVSVNGDGVKLYVNGVEDGATTFSTTALTGETFVEVGRSGEQFFDGQIRELRLWGTALAEFPIHQRFQKPAPQVQDLLAYWAFADFDGVFALDSSASANHLRMGGLEPARKPTLFERALTADNDFWQQQRSVLTFNRAGDGIVVPPGNETNPSQRQTVEVWVKVTDPNITRRKQVIYHSGNDQQGLVIYAHDGKLHFGGYDQTTNGPGWQGTWLQTDRLQADRWHHVALVLDGRAEVRPEAFRAYLDGKLVDLGDGAQLTTVSPAMLGAAAGQIRFHDVVASASGTHLEGAVLELRLWDTARTSGEIAANRYATLVGNEPYLALWWQFKGLSADDRQIVDGSGRDLTATLDNLARLQPLEPLSLGSQPSPELNTQALMNLATFRELMGRHRQSVERLAALWYDLRHTGRADNATFFDRVFNPLGLTATPWGYHDPACRWDVTGQELPSRDRAIRSRLMGALQVTSDDLDQLVALLSGTETPIEVDIAYLRQLYSLSQIPKVLGLTLREYLVVLKQLGLTQVTSLEEMALVCDRIAALRRIGVSVDELDFFVNEGAHDIIRPAFTDATIRTFADDLVRQSVEFLVAPLTFTSESISELLSAQIVEFFKPSEAETTIGAFTRRYFVDDLGAVTDRYQSPEDLRPLAEQQNWAAPFARLGANIFTALQTAGFVNQFGIVLRSADRDQFPTAFGNNPPNPTVLANIQAVLENQNNRQNAIIETLERFRNEHRNAILAGLAELLGVEPEPLQVVIDSFRAIQEPLSDPALLLDQLIALEETQPIPAKLLDYLFRLHRVLYLVAKFELSAAAIRVLLERPESFSVSNVFSPSLEDLVNLFTFAELKAAFGDSNDQLVRLLTLTSGTVALGEAILDISGWDEPQLVALIKHFGHDLAYNRVENLIRLHRAFALAEQLRVDASFLVQFSATDNLSLAFYRQQANALLSVLRALYDNEQFPKVFRPLRDPLAVQKRDALLALAMEDIPDTFAGRRSPDLLSEFLLLDVQVGSEVETSHIVQGTAALQQYVQRCLMNLESGIDPETIPQEEWAWMQNYRVWEANRKVFLYPESFIEPELRDTKTPLFSELEQALMQVDISQETVTQAYSSYLNSFAELANLKIIGAYRHKDLANPDADEVLYLVGRTTTEPRLYYYRELVNGVTWKPWEQIDLTITADFISPVFAFGRLYLFWVEFEEFSEPAGDNNQDSVSRFRPTIRYSYPDFNGGWLPPQTYEISILGVASAQQAFNRAHQAFEDLRTAFGALNLGSVSRAQLNRVIELTHAFADSIAPPQGETINRDARGAVQDILNNSPSLASQLNPIIDSLNGQAKHLRDVLNNQQEILNRIDRTSEPVNLLAFNFVLFFALLSEIFRVSQSANDSLAATFITLNDVVDEELILTAEQRRQRQWQQVYAQHAVFTPPANPQTEQERNALVVEITRNAPITASLPIFASMANLTWSLWVNCVNPFPNGTLQPAATTVELFNYANGAVRVTATNLVESLQGLERLVEAVLTTLTEINPILDDNRFETSEAGSLERLLGQTRDQMNTILNNPGIGNSPAEVVQQLRRVADDFRAHFDQLNSGFENLEFQRLQNQSMPQAIDVLGNVRRFISNRVRVSIQLNQQEAMNFDMPYGQWRHLAIVMTHRNGAYSITVHQHQVDGGQITPSPTAQVTSELLPGTRSLVLAGSVTTVPSSHNDTLVAQISEFRAWDRAQDVDTIRQERNLRIAARQVGLLRLALNRQLANTAPLWLVLSNLTFTVQLPSQNAEPRERIILFFGGDEIIRTRRNNLDEQSLFLTLQHPTNNPHHDVTISSASDLFIAQNRDLVTDNFIPGDGPSDANFLINDLPFNEVSLLDVQNQPGWYILSTGDEQFLMQAQVTDQVGRPVDSPLTAEERLRLIFGTHGGAEQQAVSLFFEPDARLDVRTPFAPSYRMERLSSFAIEDLSVRLFGGGLDSLLSINAQRTAEVNFERYDYNDRLIIPPTQFNGANDTIDFDGSLGLYYYEIFFHIPFFIANQLNANQNFAEAQQWYHYIFNPTASTSEGGTQDNPNNRFWRFLPFRDLPLEPLSAILDNEAALEAYRNDPFDPHAIARLRINAYQKAVVMKYIDNLLDWGDNLFAQESRESINEAFQLYILAYNLLGPRPEARASKNFEEIGSYEGIREAFEQEPEFLPDFLSELDMNGNGFASNGSITLSQNGHIITTFCVPENADFIGFWDRVEDRLFKIRHSLNLEGTFRQLALFQPPLDVRALVQAAAAGGRDIGSLLADLNVAVPHYRYSFILDRAKEMIGNVKDLGSALLDVLEKRDAEQLAVLQNTHEQRILDLTTRALELERDQAKIALEAMEISRDRINARITRFDTLINNGLIAEETADLVLKGVSQGFKSVAGLLKSSASGLNAAPNIIAGGAGVASPVTLVMSGGSNAGEVFSEWGDAFQVFGDLTETAGDITAKVGEYKRRASEWAFELQTAQHDLNEVNQQIEMANLQIQRAEHALTVHQRNIQNSQEVATFYRRKFTNQALYNWMVSRLSGLYFQAYKLAYDFAKSAEKAMQFELPTNERFINFGHWDSLRRGLLAGESLLLDVSRMEKFQLDNDSRFLEIEKTIPLSRVDAAALRQLLTTGRCEFRLSEALYNRDYPGHYFRVIKSIALSIKFPDGSPLQNDPFLTINSSLTQVGNKTLLDPDINAVRYLMGIEGATQPSGSSLRVNWRSNQQIAVSSPRKDNGMFGSFDLNFRFDDRYFPFEGTGAVSNWQLEIPQTTNPDLVRRIGTATELAIQDVIIHIKYTSKFDRGQFKTQVEEQMRNLG